MKRRSRPEGRVDLVIATTVPMSLNWLLRKQPSFLAHYFSIRLVTSPSPEVSEVEAREGVAVSTVEMTRRISPLRDVLALVRLYRLFRSLRPRLVHAYTPKAGLLCMVAAWLARVPHRIYSNVGLPLMEAAGARRWVLIQVERLTQAAATHVFANSRGLAEFVETEVTGRRPQVIGNGSVNGVDLDHFAPDDFDATRAATRAKLGLPDDAFVFLFIGRLVVDKGIRELLAAVSALARHHPEARLLVVGDRDEGRQRLPAEIAHQLQSDPLIVATGSVGDLRPYLSSADALVLPSYREGLPNVLLEAGSFGLPLIASDINGNNEVVIPGRNGMLVPVRDSDALATAMRRMVEDGPMRKRMMADARPAIAERFDQATLHGHLLAIYQEILGADSPP